MGLFIWWPQTALHLVKRGSVHPSVFCCYASIDDNWASDMKVCGGHCAPLPMTMASWLLVRQLDTSLSCLGDHSSRGRDVYRGEDVTYIQHNEPKLGFLILDP